MMRNNKFGVLLAIVFSLCALSCQEPQAPKPFTDYQAGTKVSEAADEVRTTREGMVESAGVIQEETKSIRIDTSEIEKKVPKESKPQIDGHIKNINDSTKSIDHQSLAILTLEEQLMHSQTKILEAETNISEMEDATKAAIKSATVAEKEQQKLHKQVNELKTDQKNAAKKMIHWLIVSCIIGGGIAIALAFFGHWAIGGTLGLACGATLTLAITVEAYFDYIAYGGLFILGLGVAIMIYQLFVKRKAFEEVVHTTELAKDKLDPANRSKIFGDRTEPGLASVIQNKMTEKQVRQQRKQLKNQWGSILDKDRESVTLDPYR